MVPKDESKPPDLCPPLSTQRPPLLTVKFALKVSSHLLLMQKKKMKKECRFQIIQVSLLKQGQNIWKHCRWLFQVGVLIHATNRLLFSDSNKSRAFLPPWMERQGGNGTHQKETRGWGDERWVRVSGEEAALLKQRVEPQNRSVPLPFLSAEQGRAHFSPINGTEQLHVPR